MSATRAIPADPAAPQADRIRWATTDLAVETPSWGFGNTGHALQGLSAAGRPARPVREGRRRGHRRAATPGSRRSIALHIPWDRVDDFSGAGRFARERGVRIGGINSNTFQDEDYKLGSLCHPSPTCAARRSTHILECCDIARQTGSDIVKVWLADGTNYPGQDDFRARRRRLIDAPARDLRGAARQRAACSSSTSSTSRPSITPTSRTGASR